MIKGILINDKAQVITIKDTLDEYYRILNCDCIDIVTRKINGKYFDIICDDEGLLKDNPIIRSINKHGEPMLVGNLFIVNTPDDEGNLQSLNEDDIALIHKNLLSYKERVILISEYY